MLPPFSCPDVKTAVPYSAGQWERAIAPLTAFILIQSVKTATPTSFLLQEKKNMIGAIIGAATSIGGSILGGIKARRAAKKANAQLDRTEKENQAWYDRKYNEDYTQGAMAQAALNKAKEAVSENMRNATGSSVVTGATAEEAARAKNAANEVISDTLSNITQEGQQRKDSIEQQYLNTRNSIEQQRMALYNRQAANATNGANQAMTAGMGLAGADIRSKLGMGQGLFESLFKKKKSSNDYTGQA